MGRRGLSKKAQAIKPLLAEGYQSGLTLRQLAFIYEISPGTVRTRLAEMGIKLRGPGRRKKEK